MSARLSAVALAAAIVVAGFAGSACRTGARLGEAPAIARFPLTIEPIERVSSQAFGATVATSPDGRILAYVGAKGRARRQLYVRTLGQTGARALPGTDGAAQLFFSPDGKWLGFVVGRQLEKVALDGGPAIPLTDVGAIYGASWAQNDQIVFSTQHRLEVVSASGGAPRALTRPDTGAGELEPRWPVVLPDGKTVLYASLGYDDVAGARIGVASLETGKTRILDLLGAVPLGVIDGRLGYVTATGALMVVPFDAQRQRVTGTPVRVLERVMVGEAKAALSQAGLLMYPRAVFSSKLFLADADDSTRTLIEGPTRYARPRFSPDGKRIAITVYAPIAGRDVWIYEVGSRTLTPLTSRDPNKVRDFRDNDRAEWTPDGKRVVFTSNRSGMSWLWWQPADGSAPAEPLLKAAGVVDAVLSPDGRTLIYTVNSAQNKAAIWYRHLDGDTVPKPITTPGLNEAAPRLSPDGRWLAYTSNESDTNQVYVRAFPGPGAQFRVSVAGGVTPVWSRDGRRLFYIANNQLLSATLTTAPAFVVTARRTVVAGVFDGQETHADYDVSPDGTRFLLHSYDNANTVAPTDASTIVVRDWREVLRAHSALTSLPAELATPPAATAPPRTAGPGKGACESLASLRLANTTITVAQPITGGLFTPPGTTGPITNLPPFCRIAGEITPTPDSHIRFEVWLPLDHWNGRFSGVGNNNYWAGSIRFTDSPGPTTIMPSLAEQLRRGNASAATNFGHDYPTLCYGSRCIPREDENAARFAFEHPEQLIDFAYRSYHEMTVKAKGLVEAFYGRPPDHSYSIGCAGAEGLMEAQRFPDDYDGVVTGAPANNWTRLMAGDLDGSLALLKDSTSSVPGSLRGLLNRTMFAACDRVDGLADGIVDDPRRCTFDPAVLTCAGHQTSGCLTPAQVEAVRHEYAGLKDPRSGAQLYPGFALGSEAHWANGSLAGPLFTPIAYFKWLVFADPNWEWREFDFTRPADFQAFVSSEAKLAPILNATNPDLRLFRQHGGKLLVYHGWIDAEHAPQNSIDYYDSVLSFFSSGSGDRAVALRDVQSFYRLFMVPGMRACGVGNGGAPCLFDMQSAVELWVEHGVAPDAVIATHSTDPIVDSSRPTTGVVDRSRPLCPYPKVAVYSGTGDTNDAANFACRDSNGKR